MGSMIGEFPEILQLKTAAVCVMMAITLLFFGVPFQNTEGLIIFLAVCAGAAFSYWNYKRLKKKYNSPF